MKHTPWPWLTDSSTRLLVTRAKRPNKPAGEAHWARLKTAVDLPLRLGAWYRVVAPVTALEVVVSIQGTRVSVPRPYVELRATPPGEWTVVRDPKVRSDRTPQALRQGYIVCPGCRRRVELPATRLAEQLCPHCNATFPIAWDERPRTQP